MMAEHLGRERLSAFADGELPAAEWAAVEGHVAGCADCRAALAETRWLNESLGRLAAAPVPAAFRRDAVALAAGHPRVAGVLGADAPPGAAPGPAGAGRLLPWPGRRLVAVVGLATAAVLVLLSLAAVCRGQPGLRACLGAGLGGPRSVRMAVAPPPTPVLRQGPAAATSASATPLATADGWVVPVEDGVGGGELEPGTDMPTGVPVAGVEGTRAAGRGERVWLPAVVVEGDFGR